MMMTADTSTSCSARSSSPSSHPCNPSMTMNSSTSASSVADGNAVTGSTSRSDSAFNIENTLPKLQASSTIAVASAVDPNELVAALDDRLSKPATFLERVARHEAAVYDVDEVASHIDRELVINGEELTLADVANVAFHGAKVKISEDGQIRTRVEASIAFLRQHLDQGKTVYGVNTGFGGSATTRSADLINTQRGLVQLLNSGVILSPETARRSEALAALDKHELSRPAVRASMLIRANCLLRGHSAVRMSVIETLLALLNLDFIPVIPLRGSISASGDLSPLSYIAGAMEGSTDILVDCKCPDGSRETVPANIALQRAGLSPIVMGPKEGLGLLNGTAVSCAVAGLALRETHSLALAAQVLTGMCTEAMGGCADNFHPFIARVRPHPGQVETAANIFRQLRGSRFVSTKADAAGELWQDRYALRTASQWIGPYLEDLALADDQLAVELNSTTDNPLIDVVTGRIHNGGNFQAVAVTSATEKARLALQMFGKLLFAQCAELINPMLNNILSPNLCFDDPSTSFTCKGVDISMAAYMAELAFLANPVSSHVQPAEMQNQAVNSLALVSARYTLAAVECVSLMVAAYLFALCQALDLHALFREYTAVILSQARREFDTLLRPAFAEDSAAAAAENCWRAVAKEIVAALVTHKIRNDSDRAQLAAQATLIPLTQALLAHKADLSPLAIWLPRLTEIISVAVRDTRIRFSDPAMSGPTTTAYLSRGSAVVYRFVREELQIPLHRGLVADPCYPENERDGVKVALEEKRAVGSWIGVIYAAVREGRFGRVWVESLS